MDGLLIIDKPAGMTSTDVVRRVRRLLKLRRVGHCGTLDPMATGVLPIAVGEGTKLVQFLMEGVKTYRATMKLGEVTDTQDADGVVIERRPLGGLHSDQIIAAAQDFLGTIQQIPPMYSALKKDGVPLYKLARQGLEIDRDLRTIHISRLELLAIELPLVTFEVDCSKGTYVRTLAHDLGLALGVGAHLTALRRTRNGAFDEAQSISPEQLEVQWLQQGTLPLLSPEQGLIGLPALELTPPAAARLADGVPPELSGVVGGFAGLPGEVVTLRLAGRVLFAARFAPGREQELRGDFELIRGFRRPEAVD